MSVRAAMKRDIDKHKAEADEAHGNAKNLNTQALEYKNKMLEYKTKAKETKDASTNKFFFASLRSLVGLFFLRLGRSLLSVGPEILGLF
jgi:hypothetical protein